MDAAKDLKMRYLGRTNNRKLRYMDTIVFKHVHKESGKWYSALEALQRADSSRDSVPSCPAEDIFLCRLLKSNSIGKDGSEEIARGRGRELGRGQADRSSVIRKEKELSMKIESLDALKSSNDNPDSTIENLEQQLQQIINENNELEIRMEEAVQDSERKDIKAEFQVMASALSKEMEMMKSQLNRWKDTASEAVSLKEEAQSLRALVDKKVFAYRQSEHKDLVDNCSEQSAEIKSLQAHLVSESVKMKQSHIFLLSENQTLDKQLHQVNAAVESLKSRIVQSEEQMNACVTHALKSTEEDRHLPVNLENSKSELSNADKELKCLKSLLS
ncbi:E3 ubiquitin protein ligase BRE1-like protein 2 [Tanacetum coccineum]